MKTQLNLTARTSVRNPNTSTGASEIPVSLVIESPHQPRLHMALEALRSLAESIEEQGVLQPILVRQKGKKYELLAGHRRLAATKLAGLERIPAIVKEVSESEAQLIALTENLNREDISPIEEATALKALQEQTGWGVREISRKVGRAPSTVSDALKISSVLTYEGLKKAGISDPNAVPFSALLNVAKQEKADTRKTLLGILAGKSAPGTTERAVAAAPAPSWKLSEKGSRWQISAFDPKKLPKKEKRELKAALESLIASLGV